MKNLLILKNIILDFYYRNKRSSTYQDFLLKINYLFLVILMPSAIWHRELSVEILGQRKGLYSYLILITVMFWIATNLIVYIKEKITLIKLKNLLIPTIFYLAIFLLNYQSYNQFSFLKLVCFILIGSLILEIDVKRIRSMIFFSGILSFIVYLLIFIREFQIMSLDVFNFSTARLNFSDSGPNAIASSLLVTILLLTSRKKSRDNLLSKLPLISFFCILYISLFFTQSRSFLLIAFVNTSLILFFKFRNHIELFIGSFLSFFYLKYLDFDKAVNTNFELPDNKGTTLELLLLRFKGIKQDRAGGRIDILEKCFDSMPTRIIKNIGDSKGIQDMDDCSTYSSHSILFDTITAEGSLFIKLFYFFSIYGTYSFLAILSIYKNNLLSLNLSLFTVGGSLVTNSMKEPMQLILIPIIFKLLEEPRNKSFK